MMDYASKEGEILFFGLDGALCGMLSALSGVSGCGAADVSPRLCIADGEDPQAYDRCVKKAKTCGAAVLVIGGEVRGTYHLPRPFLFSDFTDLIGQVFSADTVEDRISSPGKPVVRHLSVTSDGWISVGENRCHLSPAETQIFRLLLQNAPQPVARGTLSQVFVGKSSNSVDVYVSYLRRKLRELAPQMGIVSVRGQGYALIGGEFISN